MKLQESTDADRSMLDISKSVYKKKQTDLILLDFSKAFDKISHEKLALKLHDYGIRGPALKWVKGFHGVAQWVARLTLDWWIPVSREFEPHQRPPLFP